MERRMTGKNNNLLSVVFKLMDRGLSGEEIDCAMQQFVGKDWKEIQVAAWFMRLQDNRLLDNIAKIREERYVDELETLIRRRSI